VSDRIDPTTDTVIQEVPLGAQWPMVDPFLFCAHHDDRYPAGTADLGPVGGAAGRQIGSDFSGKDGWSMYHGSVVPGFPAHPHRGFETVTFVRRGLIDHADSLGAAARFGRGDVQWVTAGSGISHSEMFPLLNRDGSNHIELFQIWLNLPARNKLVEPHFTMLWGEDIPRIEVGASTAAAADTGAGGTTGAGAGGGTGAGDSTGAGAGGSTGVDTGAGGSVTATVIAGRLGDAVPPPPPPSSWASDPDADVAIWHVEFDAGGQWMLPAAAGPDTVRTVYVFDGGTLAIDGHELPAGTGALVRCDRPVQAVAGDARVECLVLQGRPIAEPVARYGPFVMNTRAEIEQAFRDYQRTGFGNWPWGVDDPVHGTAKRRFARHADGRTEERPLSATV
jgi:quercetin 2,3-dioxygenase